MYYTANIEGFGNVKEKLKEIGLELKPAIKVSESKKENSKFDSLFCVVYKGVGISYIRINENSTFDTIDFLNFPSSFRSHMKNLSLEKVMDVLQSVITNNFKSA